MKKPPKLLLAQIANLEAKYHLSRNYVYAPGSTFSHPTAPTCVPGTLVTA